MPAVPVGLLLLDLWKCDQVGNQRRGDVQNPKRDKRPVGVASPCQIVYGATERPWPYHVGLSHQGTDHPMHVGNRSTARDECDYTGNREKAHGIDRSERVEGRGLYRIFELPAIAHPGG